MLQTLAYRFYGIQEDFYFQLVFIIPLSPLVPLQLTNTNSSWLLRVGDLIEESFLTLTGIRVIGINTQCVLVTIVVLWISTLIESTNSSGCRWHLVFEWCLTLALVSVDLVNAHGVWRAVIEILSEAFVDDWKWGN